MPDSQTPEIHDVVKASIELDTYVANALHSSPDKFNEYREWLGTIITAATLAAQKALLLKLKSSADMTSNPEAKANTYDVNIVAELANLERQQLGKESRE